MKQPNDSQWAPIRNTTDHLLVTAGAGTGKTFTVVGKILYLLGVKIRGEEHAPPLELREIAAITFTNQAAADLKRKLRKGLREAGRRREAQEVDTARIGTIHSFCGDVLREFALRTGRPPGGRVLDDGEGAALLAETVRDASLQALQEAEIPGLDSLFADYGVREVEGWVANLAGEGDRLARYLARHEQAGQRERALLALADLARTRLQERLRAEGAVDFDTMIVATRDLLKSEPAVLRALRRRIRVLIVDEFQDVDPVQREIAELLGDPESRRADTPRLMFVGDPKQSIYRFRRADVTVWTEVERGFRAGLGRVLRLEESFRSVAPVLGWVDAQIGPILDRPIEGEALQDYEIPFASVRATRDDGPTDRAVEYILIPPQDDGKAYNAEEARRIEAEAVARRMLELREQMLAELPEGAPAERRRIWGQMAVLLASWRDLPIYRSALERQGIPTYPLRNEGFYGRREVVDLLLALRVARDPCDDAALFGFLRSPFVGVKDETLLALARQARQPCWERRAEVRVPEQALLERGLGLVERLAALRDRVPVAELLGELLRETGYLAHLALLGEEGRQPLANVRQFLHFAAAHADAGVGELLRQVATARERGDRAEDARLYGEQDDVVTITSIHSAKGLEWGVVFWCDLCRGRHNGSERLQLGRETLVLGEPDVKAEEQPGDWQALRQAQAREEEAEQKRLWYVAATRAKDHLILSGIKLGKTPRHGGSPAEALIEALDPSLGLGPVRYTDAEGRSYAAMVHIADPALVPEEPEVEEAKPIGEIGELAGPRAPLPLALGRPRHSATSLLEHARCPRKHWFQYVIGIRERDLSDARATGAEAPTGLSARDYGLVVHEVLERLTLEQELDGLLDDALQRLDDGWTTRAPAAQAELRARLVEEIERARRDPAFASLADHRGARRELGFLYIADAEHHAVGSIDLAAPGPDGLELLDIKTNAIPAADAVAVAEGYRPQREVYHAAAAAISGLPAASFAFHFSRPGVQIHAELAGETEAQARARFLARAAAIGRGVPELASDPRHCTGCGYRAVGWCEGVGGALTP